MLAWTWNPWFLFWMCFQTLSKTRLGAMAFVVTSEGRRAHSSSPRTVDLVLHDRSATTWFRVGDTVVVVEDVFLGNGQNIRGKQGKVLETWEKCEVDPTCCCAEQVDTDMAVRVQFFGADDDNDNDDANNVDSNKSTDDTFTYYFAENELDKAEK